MESCAGYWARYRRFGEKFLIVLTFQFLTTLWKADMQTILIQCDAQSPRYSSKRTSAVVMVRLGWVFFSSSSSSSFFFSWRTARKYLQRFPREGDFWICSWKLKRNWPIEKCMVDIAIQHFRQEEFYDQRKEILIN